MLWHDRKYHLSNTQQNFRVATNLLLCQCWEMIAVFPNVIRVVWIIPYTSEFLNILMSFSKQLNSSGFGSSRSQSLNTNTSIVLGWRTLITYHSLCGYVQHLGGMKSSELLLATIVLKSLCAKISADKTCNAPASIYAYSCACSEAFGLLKTVPFAYFQSRYSSFWATFPLPFSL